MIALYVSLLALAAIVFKGLDVINRMGRDTCHCMRASWILLTITAAVLAVAALESPPSWPLVMFEVSVAALVLLERRAIHCGSGDADC